jgi:hypothetical protein
MFNMHMTIKTAHERTANVVINCPDCLATGVVGHGHIEIEQARVLFLIPLFSHRTNWVTCSACQSKLQAKLSTNELVGLSPEQLGLWIRKRVSPVRTVLAVSALALFYLPVFGLVLSMLAFVVTRGIRGWQRRASVVALWLSICINFLFGILWIIVPPK